ncbi:MAG: energy transducer TonB [Spirochaetaceae bacterium]|jgi:protein TonB|nr:energy transducer TonB [Spirochaetaceae bacterium]
MNRLNIRQRAEKKPPSRTLIFALVGLAHIALLFLVVFSVETVVQHTEERAQVMKLADIQIEEPPPPLQEQHISEAVAENILETEEIPDLVKQDDAASQGDAENYLGQNEVSVLPEFNEMDIRRSTIYPPIALRAGITGKVYLEIFVDREGYVRQVRVLKETPEGHNFGEAATKAFYGKRGKPAFANGEPVAVRYRYPVTFQIR